ncbi:hypothetical protein BJ998_002594 [Kutzneria kofuensis]|uniref:Uncharacterized protein n=1 Tax=Kutzneria kofuensis TaxID=103725 RepID=A0A7W9NGT5_9PSEU|nr:hypothetical protein [Kutzneria kofuensis]MBB5891398.1 hypothetical protein [Kutzneria kofuensis]
MASHISPASSATSGYSITPSPPADVARLPLLGSRTVGSQSGAPRETFFSKNFWPVTPSGLRITVTGRPARCGNRTGATQT